jgi:aminoglycoside phosphotransferase (APT) family kinase protein
MEPSAIDMTIGALQRFLDAVEPERGATVTVVVPLSGGYSRDTAIADVIWSDGASERFVLRADPPAGTGVFLSDRDPEWRLLRVLQNTGPVRIPKSRWYDAEGQYFGTKCIVSSFYESRALQEIARDPGALAAARDTFVDVMVDIHRTPSAASQPTWPVRPTGTSTSTVWSTCSTTSAAAGRTAVPHFATPPLACGPTVPNPCP